ncbi:MAG: AIPR family protein [Arcticibacter sp.]
MEISEFLTYRNDLFDEAKDEDGYITESGFINICLPSLSDAKLIESDDYTDCYFFLKQENVKINGYKINESEERLQVFVVNEESLRLNASTEDLLISHRNYYDSQFSKATRFISKSIKKHLDDELQDSSTVKSLINFISSSSLGLAQIDVIEIFLISATATVEKRGSEPQPKLLEFEDESITVTVTNADRTGRKKEISVFKRLIDLNFLYNVLISQGNREVLEIDFERLFGQGIQAIKAADEQHFESYLCVLPANILSDLYRRYSTRMLEKNVRSFLQFKGVNQGIKETIRKNPEYFIAYNNGLTITAVGAKTVNVGEVTKINSLTDFQIVNGGQTTATIYFSQKEGLDISSIRVMAKINIARNAEEEKLNELISNISKFSNAQSKVSNADLRSRNEQLIKLKSLSESILTPSGKKWYFERFKGEFNTLIRKNPKAKTRINNEYPKERRYTKEELAKYYMSWDEHPYMVKKGGDKIFRSFIEKISGSEKAGKGPVIDRDFYEELIAKIILFKSLEHIYGAGKNAIGQLRSAVVPYTLSILFTHTTGAKGSDDFDLIKVWNREGIEQDLKDVLTSLMELMNELIKKYSSSDDYGEFSKRKELWEQVQGSTEIKAFTSAPDFVKVMKKYSLSKEDLKKRLQKKNKVKSADFTNLAENVRIFSRRSDYYKKLGVFVSDVVSQAQRNKIDHIIYCINNKVDIDESYCKFEAELTRKIRIEMPDVFDKIGVDEDTQWITAFDFVTNLYNQCLADGADIMSAFQRQREIAKLKGANFYSVFDEIGRRLSEGKEPTMKQLQSVGNIQGNF